MSYVSGSKTYDYGIHASRPDVPPSLSSSVLPRPINSQVQIVSLSSASGNQQASGLVSFQIPTGASAGYLKNNSLYLKARVKLNNAAVLTAVASFQQKSKSGSSIINRLTVSIGGTQVSQITNYQYLHEMLLAHTTSFNYYTNDSSIMQYTGVDAFAIGAAINAYVDIVIPLICPLWNGSKSLPLFLLNSPIKIDIDLNSVNLAFNSAAANDFTNYTVENAQLVYEQLQVDADFTNEVKMAMMQGSLYQLNLNDFMTLTTSSTQSLNYQIGTNLSSVRGVLFTQVLSTPSKATLSALTANTQTNARLYMDGRQINNFNLDNTAQQYAEMNRTLGNLFDSNITTATNRSDYLANDYVGGISTNKVSDQFAMTGTKCQNINLQLDSAGSSVNPFNTYIVVLYDRILTIDAAGSCGLIQ